MVTDVKRQQPLGKSGAVRSASSHVFLITDDDGVTIRFVSAQSATKQETGSTTEDEHRA